MKLTIKYEPDEIKALVREDLARQGIPAADAQIKFDTDCVIIFVEATRDGALASKLPSPPVSTNTVTPTSPVVQGTSTPTMKVVDGGAQTVDMSDILSASRKIATERTLMEGESHDYPGAPKR